MAKKTVLLSVVAALSMSAAVVAHAESAPVYDADTMQHDDYSLDQGQDLPMPPPPGQDSGAFVPPHPPANGTPTVAVAQDNTAVEQRMKKLEQQINTLQTSTSAAHVEALQKEVQSLRGQVEELTHQNKQLQDQQKSMYSDLDKRLSTDKQAAKKSGDPAADDSDAGLEIKANQKVVKKVVKPAVTPDEDKEEVAAAAANNADQPNVAEEQQIYQTAYNQIKAKKYDDAVKTLQNMLKKYPTGQFASNAHYWLGELYGLMGKHEDALAEFNIVAKDYPESPRVSDAQLKIGLIYAAQFNWSDAKSTFKKIINRYPGTASARLASDQLKQIKDAGH